MVQNRRAKGQARQERIVEATIQVISDRGLNKFRIADVAELAGISAGHLTYYFGTRTELLMAAIRWSEERYILVVRAELAEIRDPWTRLERLVERAAAEGPGDPGWRLWFEVWSAADGDPSVGRVYEELDARWRGAFADVIRYGHAQGVFADVDADRIARLISSVVDGLSFQLTFGSSGVSRGAVLEWSLQAARCFLASRVAEPVRHSTVEQRHPYPKAREY